jgi:GNAT superfamily N-acetyltransferase
VKRKAWRPRVTIHPRMAFAWESQAPQYPPFGPAGISYFKGVTFKDNGLPDDFYVDCLLWRDEAGVLRGILNHYPMGHTLEEKGNVNIWVQPGWQGRGIGTALAREAMRRWPLNLKQQRFTPSGAKLAEKLLREAAGDLPQSKVP